MPTSDRFIVLEQELNKLRDQFLPEAFDPTGSYSEQQLALTIAYRVLAHAEIEAYIEDRVWDATRYAKQCWDDQGQCTRTLLCLLAFSGEKMNLPPDTLTPVRASRAAEINRKVDLAVNAFWRVVDKNHGLKEANLLSLLLPIGIDSNDLDPAMLATMNAFGEGRGFFAHCSASSYRTQQPPDPATELQTIQQIAADLRNLDQLISDLMQS